MLATVNIIFDLFSKQVGKKIQNEIFFFKFVINHRKPKQKEAPFICVSFFLIKHVIIYILYIDWIESNA